MPLDSNLNQLELADLVRRLPELADIGELAYLFKHTLVQETARGALLNQERKRLNRLVGESLEALYPQRRAELAALLAGHFGDAGDDHKAFEYEVLAAEEATKLNANIEAVDFYGSAIQRAERIHATSDQVKQLYLKRGRTLELANRYADALENYAALERAGNARADRSMELAAITKSAVARSVPSPVYEPVQGQALCDRALALARELGDPAAEAEVLWALMLLHSRVGTGNVMAIQYGEEALRLARAHNLRERIAYLLNDLSALLVFHGEIERGVAYNLEARGMWRELDNMAMLSGNLGYAVMNHLILGEYDEAIATEQEALILSREIGNTWNEAFAQSWIGEAYQEHGEITAARDVMQTAIDLGTRAFPPTHVMSQADLGRLHADFGEYAGALEIAGRALEVSETRFPSLRAWAAGALAHVNVCVGDLARARELLINAPPLDGTEGNPRFALETARAQIDLALAEGDAPRALSLSATLLAYLEKSRFGQYIPEVHQKRAQALIALGEWNTAAAALAQARSIALAQTARWSLLRILETEFELARARGDAAAAHAVQTEAAALIEYIAARTPALWRAHLRARIPNEHGS